MNSVRKMIDRVFILILFVLILHQVFFSFIANKYVWMLIYSLIELIFLSMHYPLVRTLKEGVFRKAKKIICISIVVYLLSIIWALVVITIFDGEFSYLQYWVVNTLRYVMLYMFLGCLAYKYNKDRELIYNFVSLFVYANLINILASVCFLLIPYSREIWSTIILQDESALDASEGIFAISRYSLRGYTGFETTIKCTLGVIFSLYLIEKNKKIVQGSIVVLILLLGNAMYGRSGLLCSILCVCILCPIYLTEGRRVLIMIWTEIFMLVGIIMLILQLVPELNIWAEWVMEPVMALLNGYEHGTFSLGGSGDIMTKRMYFMPSSDWTIFFGDGYFTSDSGEYYMKTDVGIMRHMLFYGIVGEFLGYVVMLTLMLAAYFCCNKKSRYLVLAMFMAMMYFEIKGTSFNVYLGLFFTLPFLISYRIKKMEDIRG